MRLHVSHVRIPNTLVLIFFIRGVMTPPIEQLTADGYDLQFGTNVLGKLSLILYHPAADCFWNPPGHFYFTKLLLPTLIATAKTSPDGKARVVNTSSLGHIYYGLDFNTFKDGPARKRHGKTRLYSQSKYVRSSANV